jgi:hypothetical protein
MNYLSKRQKRLNKALRQMSRVGRFIAISEIIIIPHYFIINTIKDNPRIWKLKKE